jgi:hypothetical protein
MQQEKKNYYFKVNRVFYILYMLLSMYALYISLQCNNNLFSLETLIAILFPIVYIPLRMYTVRQCTFNKNITPICFS